MSWRRRNSHSRTHTHTLASAWSHTIRAMTRTGQDHSQEAYLWEIARLHITVSWNVTVTSTGWPHVKIIKSDDGGTLVPGTDGPISKSLSTNEHTYSSRLREMQPCVQVHRHTHTDTHRHTHTQSLLLISLFFFPPLKQSHKPSPEHTCTVQQQCYHMQAINSPQMSKTWCRHTAGVGGGEPLCPTCSWPLHTADLRYSKSCIVQNKLSHTCLSYQHKSKSKSAGVSYPVFQSKTILTWFLILYQDYVLHRMQPHQIIKQTRILNPQEPRWETLYGVFALDSWKANISGKSLQRVFSWGLTYIVASRGFSGR